MKLTSAFGLVLMVCAPALADSAPPTVTLTQSELGQIIEAESYKAISQMKGQEAKGAYDKVNGAFKPATSAEPKPK